MTFEPKDFNNLHMSKLKEGLDLLNISSQYFFCCGNKMLFIKKSRKYYQVIASCQCGFEALGRESVLDILYGNADLSETIRMFYSYVSRLVCNELH